MSTNSISMEATASLPKVTSTTDDAEARRPDVLPTAPTPIDVVRPVAPVVSGSHVLATASGGLDFEKQSVYFDLTAVGQDDLTSALLGQLLDGSVPATVTVKHDVTGLKLRVDFAEADAFDAVAALAEDARRKRAGIPTDAEVAAKQAAQNAAVEAEEATAKAAAQLQADTIVATLAAENKTAKMLLAERDSLQKELAAEALKLSDENSALKLELAALKASQAPGDPAAENSALPEAEAKS